MAKKRRGRPAKVGHFHDEPGPDHFLKIIFKPTFGRLIIPKAFVKWFGEIPSNIMVTTNTRCNWRMTTRIEGDDASSTRDGRPSPSPISSSMRREQASHEEERSRTKLDMELDVKTSHGRAREEREAYARGGDVSAGARTGQPTAPPGRPSQGRDAKIVNQKDKDAADLMTWRDYEALHNEMRREFRIEDDELRGKVQEISQKLDDTDATQQQDEAADEAHGRGDRPRGWTPLGHHGRGLDEEDGLGKPKFSIPKFEGGADVEEYLTWELKIEKLWSLHPNYTEDRKIKLASSEFDGYALRWWDALVRNRQEDGELPIITWRAMKEAMNSRFVPTNYLRTIYDKLTLLRQGVKTVDEYYMEMELLMQRGRVRESLEMTMQRFLNGLKLKVVLRSWALYASRAPTYGVGAIDALRPLLYSA
ncbi:hypothetical protein QYE76_069174 [Lolium multiflorum]|uniref:Retrotransposon gag domain-containing protein n=1 Tax=Lolium multiflorum TaxID=4521 RepID=A0AAD8SGR2_LOLMU|nr:hypothetical protein QYE76_069174 [Lolium multiflorum]